MINKKENIMKFYEGYIHTNGALMVKTVPEWNDHIIDQKSIFMAKYLGKKQMPSLNQARQYFIQLNGGRKYININELKKKG